MRIIGGTARGKTLVAPEGLDTRPTSDRLREALGLNAKISLVQPNSLVHSDGKTKHVTDRRKLYV